MNIVIISGRTTRDIELKKTAQGTSYCRFTLAINRKDSNGESRTEFPSCIAWGKLSETIAKYVSKGTQIGIVGRVQTSSYETDGQKRTDTSIVVERFEFLEGKKEEGKKEKADFIQVIGSGHSESLIPIDGFEEITDLDLPY